VISPTAAEAAVCTACDALAQIAGDVGEFDAEAADPVRQLIDQPLAVRCDGGRGVRCCGLRQ